MARRRCPPRRSDESALVQLVCLDDDEPGRRLDALWDLELGAEVIDPEHQRGLGHIDHLDAPDAFGAYLHALRWNTVSAADATRFQAPFRAGIQQNGVACRARKEADDLRALLERQRRAIRTSVDRLRQGDLYREPPEGQSATEQRRQLELDLAHMTARERAIDHDLEAEPAAIAALYDTRMTRLTPVGSVVTWPKTMT